MFCRIAVAVVTALIALNAVAEARDTYVNGYTRKDGTYVAPHYRTAPDSNPYNNYSTRGNTNPYTGEEGTVDPDRQPRSGSYGTIAPVQPNPYRYNPPREDPPPSYGGYGTYGTNPGSSFDNDPVPYGGRPPRYGR